MFKLTARKVATISAPGYFPDGGGLYLQVTAAGAKSWIFRYRFAGKRPEMGLGPTHTVSLAEAREAALSARKQVQAGVDPLARRRATQEAAASTPTFWNFATEFIEQQRAGWKNAKHADQWTNTLETYAKPFIGSKRIDQIGTEDIMTILQPIWTTKTETANRVRQRIETVLDAAKVKGKRSGENPARWKGHLAMLLPKPTTVSPVQNFSALPYRELPAFMASLRKRHGEAARALEFTILTVARTGMILGAVPSEIRGPDWTCPAERMKSKKEHVVPLSPAAQAIIKPRLERDLLFPNDVSGEPLSENAMLALLKRMGRGDVTVHGFRSTFKDWASETTDFPDDLSEAALAHEIPDKSKAAYKRGKMLEKRRKMMEAWAAYCDSPALPAGE
ncbi:MULTISPECIES: integrase arm-type DNA-binding domain-containing protein [unclassified Xanthomonas]|uniref:tyrosine-type recombinase/integrase n=1 Tax=unclassified Xanthomonas TaxID=2643310 RepID=UPI002A7F667C|nr:MULTISPECIES: integrase arm-type DNA-binding domain-containing protein [unclassified Xanthomonas]MDY4296847.1 integrase arm-type DNA-binding domain-containing protein [Xanthomonas sp. LF02-5]MDY4358394.1 integrase arm-type DNA-binding domain-containing protein [Xanthomonas sp. LF04-12]